MDTGVKKIKTTDDNGNEVVKTVNQQIDELLEVVNLTKVAYKKIGGFSGGMKQRVLLARALCATDKLLLLDEPATGLDPVATEELYELLKRLNREKKTTILMVSHDLNKAVSDAGLILHVNKRSGCGYFGPADKYLESDAARHFLGLDYNKNAADTEAAMEKQKVNSLDGKVKKGERYV